MKFRTVLPRPSRSRRGVALVITISLIVLVTAVVIAFFSRATANRSAEAARVRQLEAEQLALTAVDNITSKLLLALEEQSDAEAVDGVTLYKAKSPEEQSLVIQLSDAAENSTRLPSLVRQSVANADDDASAHNTAVPSQNGRSITADQWNMPRLNLQDATGEGFADEDELPHWIYLTNRGEATATPQVGNVIGRFAYNVYDISGLIDANIAGFPSAVTGTNLQTAKQSLAGADLTALGLTPAEMDALVDFRNPNLKTPVDYADYVSQAASFGFLQAAIPDLTASEQNRFFQDRRDLLRYAKVQSPGLEKALPYLTTFSLTANAPAIAVDADDDNVPDEWPLRWPNAATLTRYKDDGSSYTVDVKAGEPFLSRRFSLAKLAWLGPIGPNTTDFPNLTPAAIQACFGLVWNSSDAIWVYAGPSGSSSRSEIETLESVAQEARDPNFFELLYAGIGRESMDKAVPTIRIYQNPVPNHKAYSGSSGYLLDEAAQYQAVTIAANIMDQADRDNFPTRILFDDVEFYGLEDLPQISAIYAKAYHAGGGSRQFGDPPVSFFLIPQLWNPHRTSDYAAGEGPDSIRLEFADGSVVWRISQPEFNPATMEVDGTKNGAVSFDPPAVSIGGENVTVALTGSDFRATPDVIRPGSNVSGPLASGVDTGLPSAGFFPAVGLEIGRYTGSWPTNWLQTGDTSAPYLAPWEPHRTRPNDPQPRGPRVQIVSMTDVMVTLSYRDKSGIFRTYATFTGQKESPVTGLNTSTTAGAALNVANLYDNCRLDVGDSALRRVDPRTSRFGIFASGGSGPFEPRQDGSNSNRTSDGFSRMNYVINSTRSLTGPEGYQQEAPNLFTKLLSQGRYPIYLTWQNVESSGSDANSIYADRDGVVRPADGMVAKSDAHPMYSTTFAGASGATGAAGARTVSDRTRPIILQRPFRSVAELGYVFRGQPWKTLDFFSDKSADAALLELFCVADNEEGIIAGTINPNRAESKVIEAILKGTFLDDMDARFPSGAPAIDAALVSTDLKTALSSEALEDRSRFPELVNANTLAPAGAQAKPSREAPLRSLAEVSDFRTWRFLIDVVAQVGQFNGGTGPQQFLAPAERRYWVAVSIDRLTGKIIATSTERVTE